MEDEVVKRHPAALFVLLAVMIFTGGGAIHMMRQADARVEAADQEAVAEVLPVDVYQVSLIDVPLVIEARGFLSGLQEVTVYGEVPGRLMDRVVQEGDKVEVGDVLMHIDDTFHDLRVQQAQAQLQAAEAARDNAIEEFARIVKLYESESSPPIEYDRVETAKDTSEAEVALAKASLAEAKAYLERCAVKSPISGRVNRFALEVGEYAITTAPLVEIVRLDHMKMIVELTDREALLLDRFTKATVTTDAREESPHIAELHHVAPKVDPVSKKFRVELHVENSDESLLAGMYGKARLECGGLGKIARIPRQCVFKHFGADYCMVVEGKPGAQKAALRAVEVSDIPGFIDEVEAVSGLSPGDWVVITRRPELHEGSEVRPARITGADVDSSAKNQPADS